MGPLWSTDTDEAAALVMSVLRLDPWVTPTFQMTQGIFPGGSMSSGVSFLAPLDPMPGDEDDPFHQGRRG